MTNAVTQRHTLQHRTAFAILRAINIYESESELGFQSKCFPATLPSEEITHLESLAEVPLGHGQNVPIASPGENKIPALPKD